VAGRISPSFYGRFNGFLPDLIKVFGFIVQAKILHFGVIAKLTVFMAGTMKDIDWWVFGFVLARIIPNAVVMQGFPLFSSRFIEGKTILAERLSVQRCLSGCQVLWICAWPIESVEKLGQMMWNRIQSSKVLMTIFRNQAVSDIAKRHPSRTWLWQWQ
jgi:hypothetical protein